MFDSQWLLILVIGKIEHIFCKIKARNSSPTTPITFKKKKLSNLLESQTLSIIRISVGDEMKMLEYKQSDI